MGVVGSTEVATEAQTRTLGSGTWGSGPVSALWDADKTYRLSGPQFPLRLQRGRGVRLLPIHLEGLTVRLALLPMALSWPLRPTPRLQISFPRAGSRVGQTDGPGGGGPPSQQRDGRPDAARRVRPAPDRSAARSSAHGPPRRRPPRAPALKRICKP